MHHRPAWANFLSVTSIGMALTLFQLPCNADSKPHLAWKEPLPGTSAILGDDGGGANTAKVCDTAAKFRQWLDSTGDIAGCHSLPAGLPIILGAMSDNPALSPLVASHPLIKIVIPSRHNYSGYVQLLGGTHPNVPKGTIVHYKKGGNETLRLAPSRDSDLDTGPDLGDKVTATILQYDPASDGMNLYVEIKDGKFAGQKGWMLSLGAESDDGEPVDIFYGSIIDPTEHSNGRTLVPHPASGHDWLQANKEDIKGAVALLEGARLCHIRSPEWSKRMEARVGLYVGDNTTDNDMDEITGMIGAAKGVTDRAYAAGGKEFCERAVRPKLPVLEKKFQ